MLPQCSNGHSQSDTYIKLVDCPTKRWCGGSKLRAGLADRANDMSDQSNASRESANKQHIIDVLARETSTPAEVVEHIYVIERSKLERVARIKTYVSVLATRQVKLLLSGARQDDDVAGVH